jgi:hypothetical protein
MRVRDAWRIVGGLGEPGKMPGFAHGVPVADCRVGSRLARIPGTVCFHCYANTRRYTWRAMLAVLRRRARSLRRPSAVWCDAMVKLLDGQRWFRWFDSGDLQGVEHLRRIVAVAERTPWVRHWLPTREVATVRAFVRSGGRFPENLCVRLSGTWVDGPPPAVAPELYAAGVRTSTVHDERPPTGFACQAAAAIPGRNGKRYAPSCDTCRACWNREVPNTSYPLH